MSPEPSAQRETPPRPVPEEGRRVRQRREKRRAILKAAIPLFAERPLEAVSMEEIARKAEVATGTLYTHFANKEQLFEAATRRLFTAWHPEMMRILGDSGCPPLDRLRASMHAKHEHIERHRSFFVSLHRLGLAQASCSATAESEDPEQEATCASLIGEFMSATSRCIEEGQAAGQIRTDLSAEVLAEAMRGLSRGLTEARHQQTEVTTSVAEHADLIFSLFLDGASPDRG